MILVQPSYKLVKQKDKYPVDHIVTCYKKIYNVDSHIDSSKLIDELENNQNLNVLNHGAIYLKCPNTTFYKENYKDDVLGSIEEDMTDNTLIITTTVGYIITNDLYDDLRYQVQCSVLHDRMITVLFSIDKLSASNACFFNNKFNVSINNPYKLNKKVPNLKICIPEYLNKLPEGEYTFNEETETFTSPSIVYYKDSADPIYNFLKRRYMAEETLKTFNSQDLTLTTFRDHCALFGCYNMIVTGLDKNWEVLLDPSNINKFTAPTFKRILSEIKNKI